MQSNYKWYIDLNRELSVAKSQMAENHLKKHSACLAIGEKLFWDSIFSPVKMAKTDNTRDSSWWQGYGLRETLCKQVLASLLGSFSYHPSSPSQFPNIRE